MDDSRPDKFLRAVPPPHPATKQVVSAAAVFKQPLKVTKKPANSVYAHRVPPVHRLPPPKKPTRTKQGSSSSPNRGGRHDEKKPIGLHPLAAAFNDATHAYRRTLYKNTITRLDTTLAHLLAQLHESNLVTASSPPSTSDPNASPLKLTISDKFDRTTARLLKPIGSYGVIGGPKATLSEEHSTQLTLEKRLEAFSVKQKETVAELSNLERQWETVVGEIWKVGVRCLGEGTMSSLLLTQAPPASLSPVRATDDESTLFSLEPKPAQKRVTFQEPQRELPKFLYSPSVMKNYPSPVQLSKEDVKQLERTVTEMGVSQTNELQKIEQEQQQWWNKKVQQIALTLRDD